jgi:hypothetical protein
MKIRTTGLNLSGLRRMWRVKEYGRMYQADRRVKKRQRIAQRNKMIDGIKKMEADAKDGIAYSSAVHLEDDEKEKEENCEEPARKKAKTSNNKHTSVTRKEASCKCGECDHKRIMSSKCPWMGLSTEVMCKNYERRLEQMKVDAKSPSTPIPGEKCTDKMRVDAKGPSEATPIPSGKGTDKIVKVHW